MDTSGTDKETNRVVLKSSNKYNDVAFTSESSKKLDIENVIGTIFGPDITQEIFSVYRATQDNLKTSSMLECVQLCVRRKLECLEEELQDTEPLNDARPGRIGYKEVRFDISSHVGLFVVGADRLSINSQSNFSTLRANVCFYGGKWQFEVQLGSKGVMQIGWAMNDCKFSQEIGVGDTINSYSFDGHRVRKWNVSTYPYGESWLSGDIIGSTIDLDVGSIEFYRNGRSMGEAFGNIQMGPGFAYFPAVSLAFTENLIANFGSTPLKYPVSGFQTPERPPTAAVAKASLLLEWFERLMAFSDPKYKSRGMEDLQFVTTEGVTMLFGHLLMQFFAPLITSPYIVEACFVPFLLELGKKAVTPGKKAPSRTITAVRLNNFLDMFWIFLDESDQRRCLEIVATCLLARFRRVSFTVEYPLQKETIQMLILLCRHPKTRVYFLQNILFDKVKFANFSHVKPLDDRGLSEAIPVPCWEGVKDEVFGEETKFSKYLSDCDNLKSGVSVIEIMQKELMLSLMDNSDGTFEQPSSRRLFLSKFRLFLHESMLYSRTLPIIQTPLPITLCCFHRLIATIQVLWEREIGAVPASVPIRVFIDGSLNYFNIDRFGGVITHLQKILKAELAEELGPNNLITSSDAQESIISETLPVTAATGTTTTTIATMATNTVAAAAAVTPNPGPSITMGGNAGGNAIQDTMSSGMMLPALARMLQGQGSGGPLALILRGQGLMPTTPAEKPTVVGAIDPEASLVELIDGLILFYHLAHKQLVKVSSLRASMEEYENALKELKTRIEQVRYKDATAVIEMERAMEVFQVKLMEQSRHMAWVRAAVFSPEKQQDIVWILQVVIQTLKNASAKGKLFSFVPEFYLDVLIELTTALRSLIHPTVPLDNIDGHKQLMKDVGQFICTHFADPRIIHASSKDTLVQALANFVCNANTLQCLEELPEENQINMVRGLLRPYENRAWAQSNWVLLRFWQGNGFAFRYKTSPHWMKIGPKNSVHETTFFGQHIKPCPSTVFQNHVREIMLNDEKLATTFINSVLNQLNWAFSEFIGMLQEIQNLSSRPERVFIESRQLKICATCFDLTLSLLRVLEMIVSIAQPLFSDPSRPSSESLLERMCQLLCQVLNRVSSITGCFQFVVTLEITDLSPVDHFPILTAVIGILLGLLEGEIKTEEEMEREGEGKSSIGIVSKALLIEPSFQLTSLFFVLGEKQKEVQTKKSADTMTHKSFSFYKYPEDVSLYEIQQVKDMIAHLAWCQHRLSLVKETDEDTLCSICYAYPNSVIFYPCKHQSCRSCITHHLMNNQDCFFCKSIIQKVISNDGKLLYSVGEVNDDESNRNTSSDRENLDPDMLL